MFYRLAWLIMRLFFTLLGLKIEGTDKLPAKGAAIIVSNHVSNWDPIVVGIAFKRPVYFMAKAELFQNKLGRAFFTALNAFPVKRGSADRGAIRKAISILEEGKVLGIFPEGTRNKTGASMEAQNGAAMLALKTGAPVIPVACIGTKSLLPWGWKKPLVLRVGNPIYLEEFKGQKINSALLNQVSERIMQEIEALLSK
ncbi:1-acyl-sn-glycerol-3-phosphate acyltransferase [Thermosyntropha lipolytica DSM 11003]|uniref:1-acyl-sn-glycerol-3-phosphate acyltransferase n=1 Tax=Thermosyntropha lipolytica DSM 11003 TaxID=1123382 RepID=A0A1M5Q9J8_9FIRM|nr:lysophospholipid acyltransferase family protein [Thermosyntropha lipolytica]SHH10834.1 1-acyl-sn-glycerol-3-phosphate acyltransferase [Thermosyntropha lipolytica DSM 11003]